MPVSSMTGFARAQAAVAGLEIAWELRAVNGKGLDLKLRLPAGAEAVEGEVRRLLSARLARGNVQVALTLQRAEPPLTFRVNEALLGELTRLSALLVQDGHATLPSADGLLALRGVVETADREGSALDEEGTALVVETLVRALDDLVRAREEEGAVLRAVLERRLVEIEALAGRAERDPARQVGAIRERLARQVAELTEAGEGRLDPERLHAEAALLAARADIREELDRLHAHVAAARELLGRGGAVGRRLDFLAQEFNRESNTLCAKSNATSLTAIGLELKVVVDQFREQVQNIE